MMAIDRNHRQHARREIERETAKEMSRRIARGPRPSKRPLFLDSGLGVLQKRQELIDLGISGRGDEREILQLLNSVASGRKRALRSRGRRGRCGWRAARSKRDALEHVGTRSRRGCRGADNGERPTDFGSLRWKAHLVVAGLIPKAPGNVDGAGRRALSDRELNANGELVLEDGEWLRQAGLLKIGRFGKDKLRDSNTGRRIERELGRDQRGRGAFD